MLNVHTRQFPAPIESVRPWIEACWSGGPRDPFPHDVLRSWRRNPDGMAPDALVPGVTVLGHGPFRFRLSSWDGQRWRVDLFKGKGWHGFDLVAEEGGCRVTHTVSVPGLAGLALRVILPAHDWAVEALLDRLGEALGTGRMPERTARPLPWRAALVMRRLQA